MFIETEITPNPETLKFLPGIAVLPAQSAQFDDADSASVSPLATMLFDVEGVIRVYLGADFITLTKQESLDWIDLKPLVLSAIMQFYTTGQPVLSEGISLSVSDAPNDENVDPQIVEQIKALLEEKIRPAVAQDGGDIVYQGFKDGIVYLQMQGACAGCPSATMTLKNGVENLLKYYVPEVVGVAQV